MKLICFFRKRKAHSWVMLISLISLFGLCIVVLKPLIELIMQKIEQAKSHYAIVFDAHLSVTHMYVYTFHRSYPDRRIILDDEQYLNMTPGIFKLDKNTENITVFISALGYLLDMAGTIIPNRKHSQSPLLFRGISNIPLNGDQSVMDEEFEAMSLVENFLQISGFQIQPGYISKQSIHEAEMNLWTAVTILKGEKTALICLGSENMNVIYKTRNVEGEFINNIDRFWDSHVLHGFGISFARITTLSYRSEDDREHVISECFNPRMIGVPWTLTMNERQFLVSGPEVELLQTDEKNGHVKDILVALHDLCKKNLKTFVSSKSNFHLSRYLQDDQIEINISGYFFSRAIQAGLILAHSTEMHKVTVEEFVNASNVECMTLNFVKPWLCLDLTYISLLLRDVLNLASDRTLTLSKYTNGHRMLWPLGLAGNTWKEIFLEKDNNSVEKEY